MMATGTQTRDVRPPDDVDVEVAAAAPGAGAG